VTSYSHLNIKHEKHRSSVELLMTAMVKTLFVLRLRALWSGHSTGGPLSCYIFFFLNSLSTVTIILLIATTGASDILFG
jgi:hypothetical protein